MNALLEFGLILLGVLKDVTPIAAVLFRFQVFVLRKPMHVRRSRDYVPLPAQTPLQGRPKQPSKLQIYLLYSFP